MSVEYDNSVNIYLTHAQTSLGKKANALTGPFKFTPEKETQLSLKVYSLSAGLQMQVTVSLSFRSTLSAFYLLYL